jgi:signal recognition particle receptor subunit beta
MLFDNEIKLRILYWGPKDSGKTTNIQWLNKTFKNLGKTVTLFGDDGFTTYFEFIEPVVKFKNFYDVKYLIYSSPGEEAPKLTRDIFSQGIDSIVFVVDSRKSRLEDNKKSLFKLLELLEEYKEKKGIDPLSEAPLTPSLTFPPPTKEARLRAGFFKKLS